MGQEIQGSNILKLMDQSVSSSTKEEVQQEEKDARDMVEKIYNKRLHKDEAISSGLDFEKKDLVDIAVQTLEIDVQVQKSNVEEHSVEDKSQQVFAAIEDAGVKDMTGVLEDKVVLEIVPEVPTEDCPKLKAKEAKKKEGGSTANAGSTTNAAIIVSSVKEDFDADAEWAFSAECTYNPAVHDACMSVAADSHVWYFDSGATKHITSHRDLFTSLESVPHGNSVTCANNASYPVQGVGKIVLTAANGSSFTLVDALYVPGIKKNLLSVSALARLGLVVKFVDDRCTVHDLSSGDEIVASGILCRGLYKLTLYDKCGQNFANAVVDTKAISDAKLWHARFGHLNFASLLRLQKFDMVASLPPLEAPIKHVCEGCILGKMQRSKFPKDGSVRATCSSLENQYTTLRKMVKRWFGPYVVLHAYGNANYKLCEFDGIELKVPIVGKRIKLFKSKKVSLYLKILAWISYQGMVFASDDESNDASDEAD
ncbi:hypothetical protein L7F22_003941 [Adiantum nelumboides]|nr:hypothetical protein [Adiantum nelumboides]